MFLFTLILFVIVLIYYEISFTFTMFIYLVGISIVAAFVEGFTPKGLDNLSVPFVTAILYWIIAYNLMRKKERSLLFVPIPNLIIFMA